ncbi:solute carrier, TRAMD3 or PAT1-domain-containing protein [Cladochytrium replicatum]|nr:solute carrier, TRAMD3 or PAT1-domain-containing protein [Cladochytrium replicatum]
MPSNKVRPNRPHDYIYDPTYTVSCAKDHYQAVRSSQTHDIIIHPEFQNMFSALRHFPPSYLRLRPRHLDIDVLGQDRRIYQHPSDSGVHVAGMNRYKYFRRPMIPYIPTLGGQVVYARKPPYMQVSQKVVERPADPPTKTVAVQTVYRESQAQTDPYSPEYVLPIETETGMQLTPELLALATLSHGAGLPVGVAELEIIERARAKRAWEESLPKVVDRASFEKRLRMMEEMELLEWQEREEEICRLQEARLALLAKIVQQREVENEKMNNERIERIWNRKLQEREALLDKIEKRRIKALRKLTEKRSKVGGKLDRRDIISDYSNFASRVYAPKARDGIFSDRSAIILKPELMKDLKTYRGLCELEATFAPSVLRAEISIPNSNENLGGPTARMEFHVQEQLRQMDQKLKERKLLSRPDEKPLKYCQRIEKPPRRPPTPVCPPPVPEYNDLEMAALKLQALIRGRVAQNMMYSGKERRLQLIGELRTRQTIRRVAEQHASDAAAAAAAAAAAKASKMDAAKSKEDKATLVREQEEGVSSIGSEQWKDTETLTEKQQIERLFEANVESEYVGKTLDFLTKEIVRLREERKIAATVKLAERIRRMREAEESGRRQGELKRRQIEDEIFRQIMRVHQETVESYLEEIIADSINVRSGIEARRKVHEYARKINNVVDALQKHDKESTANPERAIVSDLVYSFLLPEVQKQTLREKGESWLQSVVAKPESFFRK